MGCCHGKPRVWSWREGSQGTFPSLRAVPAWQVPGRGQGVVHTTHSLPTGKQSGFCPPHFNKTSLAPRTMHLNLCEIWRMFRACSPASMQSWLLLSSLHRGALWPPSDPQLMIPPAPTAEVWCRHLWVASGLLHVLLACLIFLQDMNSLPTSVSWDVSPKHARFLASLEYLEVGPCPCHV